jgi:hypothetical protein
LKKLLISVILSLLLVTIMAVPAMAFVEQTTPASVTVGEVISITLLGGINFGTLSPDVEKVGATGQSSGDPAINISVEPETNINVDIGIKGALTGGSTLALINWLYSVDFAQTVITGLTASYVGVYNNVGDGSYDFYHWITIPGGTASGTHTVDVSYKAVETGSGF